MKARLYRLCFSVGTIVMIVEAVGAGRKFS